MMNPKIMNKVLAPIFALALLCCSGGAAYAVTGTDVAPGTACSVAHAMMLSANPAGTGAYILTCEGGTWQANIADTPTASNQLATKGYVDAAGGGGTCGHMQVFTADGTWTKPATTTMVWVTMVGGGGGGGGGNGSGGTYGGGGGGSGQGWIHYPVAVTGNVTVTIGAGGAGGGADANGSNGGDTTFGALLTAKGGLAGYSSPGGDHGGNGGGIGLAPGAFMSSISCGLVGNPSLAGTAGTGLGGKHGNGGNVACAGAVASGPWGCSAGGGGSYGGYGNADTGYGGNCGAGAGKGSPNNWANGSGGGGGSIFAKGGDGSTGMVSNGNCSGTVSGTAGTLGAGGGGGGGDNGNGWSACPGGAGGAGQVVVEWCE